jgi:hypothetical protein
LLYTVKETGRKPDRKPYPLPYGFRNPYRNFKSENSQDYAQKTIPLPYGLRNPYRNLKSENSQDYAQKHQQNCMFMNSASGVREREGDRATGRERAIERDTVEQSSHVIEIHLLVRIFLQQLDKMYH